MSLLLNSLIKRTCILLIIFLFAFHFANAQVTIETGISVGFNHHTFSVENGNGMLRPGVALAGTYGLPVVVKRGKWELHTGFFANDLSQSFYFSTSSGTSYGKRSFVNGISSYKIPLRIGRTIQWTDAASLSPQVGFSWLTSRRTGPTGTEKGSYGRRVEYSSINMAVNKNKFMAEAGLDLNFSIFRNYLLSLGAKYCLGLQKVQQFDVTYKIDERTYQGTVNSKGSGWKFNAALMIPIYHRR